MLLSGLSVPLVGLVDTAIVGRLPGPQYLAGVAIGALVFSYILFGFGFLRMGTTGLAAQAFGAGDLHALHALLGRAALLALLLAAGLVLLQDPLLALVLWLVEGEAEAESLGAVYFGIRIWATPAILLRLVLVGWFLGAQRARLPLVLLLLVNLLNAALDWLFVLQWQWGVAGVAWATVVAEYAGLIFGLWVFVRMKRQLALPRLEWGALFEWPALRRLLHLNSHIFLRTLLLVSCLAYFTAQGARFGTTTLAANAVLMNFFMFLAFGLDSLAHAAEALVGRALGARQRQPLLRAIQLSGGWTLTVAAGYCLVYGLGGNSLIELLTDLPEVRSAAREYLPWLVLCPLLACWSFWLDGIFIGGTWSRAMRDTMLLATLGYLLSWQWLQHWGNHGLWAALSLWLLLRGLGQAVYLYWRLRRETNGLLAQADDA